MRIEDQDVREFQEYARMRGQIAGLLPGSRLKLDGLLRLCSRRIYSATPDS